jgi:hypothetical protein
MKLREKIQELNLAVGMTHRGDCPVCKRHNTFTVSNENGNVLYNCYANSCNIKGSVMVGLSVDDIKRLINNRDREVVMKPFEFPEFIVYNDEETASYAKQYGLDHKRLDLRFDVRERRVVYPIRFNGVIVDAIGRSLTGEQPKWRRYGEARVAYTVGDSSVALVVEDAVSAAVADTIGFTGFALLGTSLLLEHQHALGQYDTVVVALDPDAAKKTLEITRELKSNGINALAFMLEDDLKYRLSNDISRLTTALKRVTDGTGITQEPTE